MRISDWSSDVCSSDLEGRRTTKRSRCLDMREIRMDFEGQVAIVTGAGGEGGIGEAIALKLARSGASVAVVDICHDDPDAPSRKLPSWDQLHAVAYRVTADGSPGRAVRKPAGEGRGGAG